MMSSSSSSWLGSSLNVSVPPDDVHDVGLVASPDASVASFGMSPSLSEVSTLIALEVDESDAVVVPSVVLLVECWDFLAVILIGWCVPCRVVGMLVVSACGVVLMMPSAIDLSSVSCT